MPNSILWIGLVVLWVFVLFPILADRHPRIRQTTDAALATRVLHRGGSKRRAKKGPAAGHDSDPDYRPSRVQSRIAHQDDAEDRMTTAADEPVTEADEDTTVRAEKPEAGADSGVAELEAGTGDADTERDGDEYDSADPGEYDRAVAEDDADAADADAERDEYDSAARDVEADADVDNNSDDVEPAVAERRANTAATADDDDVAADLPDDAPPEPRRGRIPPRSTAPARIADDYDYDDGEQDSDDEDFVPSRRGRGGYDPEADAIARAARYTFRQRAVLGLVLLALILGGLGIALNPLFWWGCGASALILVTYLAYLRKQVRMEEEIRRRRSARLSRSRQLGDQPRPRRADPGDHPGAIDRDTARALRRRSTLLEPDDEDPSWEHLDPFDPATARTVRHRAAGGDIRRAAGA